MRNHTIGSVFDTRLPLWRDGARLEFDGESFELIITDGDCSPKVIEAVKNGNAEFALTVKNEVLFFLAKLGPARIEVAFHAQLGQYKFDEVYPHSAGYTIPIYLVNSRNGVLKAIRIVSLTKEFSQRLFDEITRQANDHNFDLSTYSASLQNVLNAYTMKDLMRLSAIKCKPVRSVSTDSIAHISL